jgi:putative aminopeptidase FrvX
MNSEDKTFLHDLLRTPSPSGWETRGQQLWMDRLQQIADTVESDAYGNAWAVLQGRGGPSIMLEAHADEIGFIVRHVSEKGFLSIRPIGDSDRTLAAARRVRIFGDHGEVPGVIGHTAIHLRDTRRDRVPEWRDIYVDVGAGSPREVAALGLRVGHPAVYSDEAVEFSSGRLVGRALDNRLGGFVLARILSDLAALDERPYATVIAVNAVQEEIGCQGARMIAQRLAPEAAIVFDVTHATDTPGLDAREHGLVELGKGPTVAHGAANHPLIVRQLLEVAALAGLPVQHEAISCVTRTDADAIYTAHSGIPTALVSFPLRYMHSPTETVDLADVAHAAGLVSGWVRSIRPGDTFRTRSA